MSRQPSEFEIQRAVCIHLDGHALPGVVWWHTPNGGTRRDAFEAKRLKEIGVKPGIHDLLLLRAGRLYGLELKAEHGVTSDAQKATHKVLLAAGMTASAVHYTLDAARQQLFLWNLVDSP